MTRTLILTAALLLGSMLSATAAPKKGLAPRRAHAEASPVVPLSDPAYKNVDTLERAGVAVLPFADVPPGHWAARAVETLHRAGIVRGYPGGASRTGN
jgi:hypothetical protein